MELWAVVLAAGQARRMGGIPKPLIPVDGEPMVRRVLRRALEVADRAAVVVGFSAEQVEAAVFDLGSPRIVIVRNPRFAEGMSTSLKAGIGALPPEAAGALVMLADQPGVSVDSLRLLKNAWRRPLGPSAACPVVACRYPDGNPGPPCILGRAIWGKLAALEGDRGARQVLARLGPWIHAVEAPVEELADIDTPADLAAWRQGRAARL
ncbi:MAG: nucleotidyltransferase family protein [Bacillota bacterium]